MQKLGVSLLKVHYHFEFRTYVMKTLCFSLQFPPEDGEEIFSMEDLEAQLGDEVGEGEVGEGEEEAGVAEEEEAAGKDEL